ncbi:MAG: cysteine desulfurase [Sandaracinaceae bacterium]|jgi:cysteine desulfurase/selenocysteine lyase|nr:cysteine desulfurase [Sandaracinaceae bacterium]MBK7776493.1 cysteine desulfurase [Sandaracinaceae bacterium]MBK8408501.1 cysteine desulfurase [Sandaracinaceae bacterium]MBK8590839.1 cysteine desulfurase [Sandaracinaceae bacterium]MBP7683741.1 cysteine desulfurase [Deltaproteobacteria bacterium]
MSATPQVKPQAQQHAKEHGKESRRVTAPATVVFDAERVREDFPALHQLIGKHPLVYLDNAATALKPQSVIDAVSSVYAVDCANIHRGVHTLSQRATQRYEDARDKARRFLNAPSVEETIFVRGTTEGINLVAQCYARPRLREGDEILITELEHHSNIVPWQMVALATGAKLVVAPVNDAGEVTEDAFSSKLSTRTKMVSFAHVSNALGTILPAKRFVQLAKSVGAAVCIDGAQAAPHAAVDVQDLGCDFYAFSGHKVYGPTGIGVLYGRRELLEEMIPYQGGGDMIDRVTFAETTWNALPYKFEAGTPHIAGGIGLGAALDYLTALDPDAVAAHERDVLAYGTAQLAAVPGLRLVGTAAHKVGVLSFLMEGAHPSDVGTILDQVGVAVRTGHHCTQPLMDRFGIPATARASMALYSTRADIDALVRGLHLVREMFA